MREPRLQVSPPFIDTFKEKMKGNKVMIGCQGADLLETESIYIRNVGEVKANYLN